MAALFGRLLVAALVALPLYALARGLWLWRQKTKPFWGREITMCLFALFLAGLVALVLQPGAWYCGASGLPVTPLQRLAQRQGVNFVPLATIRGFFSGSTGGSFTVNITANVLMFVPVGLGLPLLWKRWQKAGRMLAVGALVPIGIECAQLFIGRSVDVDDVLLNLLGILLGYGVYRLLRKAAPKVAKLAY